MANQPAPLLPYALSEHKPEFALTRYKLPDNQPNTIEQAVQKITTFLQENPNLCPTFLLQPLQVFGAIVSNNPYLTINGRFVCLSGAPAPAGTPENI